MDIILVMMFVAFIAGIWVASQDLNLKYRLLLILLTSIIILLLISDGYNQ